jgi:hypothetical protein
MVSPYSFKMNTKQVQKTVNFFNQHDVLPSKGEQTNLFVFAT